jgi:glucosamine-6-phosphate deaminase
MDIRIAEDAAAAAAITAGLISHQVRTKPQAVLGLATGSTPEATYALLAEEHRSAGLDFSRVTTFNLDEYLGLSPKHPQSYRFFMNDRLFRHLNIRPENTHVPSGLPRDPEEECQQYEERIERAGGIDLQLLGIGRDGHIGFNEPGSSLQSRTRVKTLTEQTIKDNAELFFGKGQEHLVPKFAITMGVGTILEARHLVLLATGERKADIVREMVEGPVTSMVTASVLQWHPRATIVLDKAAASKLGHLDYFSWVQSQTSEYETLVTRLKAG